MDKGDVQRYGWDRAILTDRRTPSYLHSVCEALILSIIVEKSYAADDVLILGRIYDVIAARIPAIHLNAILKNCREAFQSYDLEKDKRSREHDRDEYGKQRALDAPLDVNKSSRKRGKRHYKSQ
jgi:hypothetical protein